MCVFCLFVLFEYVSVCVSSPVFFDSLSLIALTCCGLDWFLVCVSLYMVCFEFSTKFGRLIHDRVVDVLSLNHQHHMKIDVLEHRLAVGLHLDRCA